MKKVVTTIFLLIITTSSFATEDFQCLEWDTICKHKIDGKCVESKKICKEAKRTITSYSAGCDLSNIMKMINQDHCNVVVECNDPISVVGTCERGSGCYPGHYIDTCPSGYDLRNTGEVEERDCSQYGQQGTMTVQKFEYGHFSGGAAMTLQGGGVSCQKYYSPRQEPDCAERLANGERPDYCYVNECKDLANNPRCERVDDLGTTEYGNEPDVLSTDCVWIHNPGTGGNICTDDPNKIAELTDKNRLYDVKIEKYECESADVRNCKDKEYKMVCKDGSETLCQSKKTCLEWGNETVTERVEKEFTLNRNYDVKTCIVEDGNCEQYNNNPNCVVVSSNISYEDSIMPCGNPTNLNGSKWCKENSYGIVGGNNSINNQNFIDSSNCNKKGLEFLWTFTRTDGEAHTAFSWGITSNKVNSNGSIDTWGTSDVMVYQSSKIDNGVCGQRWSMSLNNVRDPGSAGFRSGRIDFWSPYILKTKRTYYCYTDYNALNVPSNCASQNSSLCLNYHNDLLNSNKYVCRTSTFQYTCDEEYNSTFCANYDEQVVCNDQSFPMPNIEMKNDNFTGFAESLALLGVLDDINSIWSGEYQYCSYGFFVNGFGGIYCNNCKGEGGFLCFQKKPEQQKAYEMNKKGLCHYLKTDCTNKIDLGFDEICIEHTRKYCCYDSKLARVIVEQAYKQLGKSWSSGCNGLTVDDLNKLDFGAMDFSEIEAEMKSKIDARTNKIGNSLKNRIEGYYTDFTEQMDQRGAHPQDPNNQ